MADSTIICNCMQITFGELQNAIKEGAVSIVSLQEKIGIATGCGRCMPQTLGVLKESK